jgi:hypothetical protein
MTDDSKHESLLGYLSMLAAGVFFPNGYVRFTNDVDHDNSTQPSQRGPMEYLEHEIACVDMDVPIGTHGHTTEIFNSQGSSTQ